MLSVMLSACGESGSSVDTAVTSSAAETAAVTEAETSAEITESTAVLSEETSAQTDEVQVTVPPETVGYEGMVPVYASALNDGKYNISVDSSSSMFRITECELTVSDGKMTAVMTMGGTGYEYIFAGTGEEAAASSESGYIPYEETDGVYRFAFPVEALDSETPCAAFSKKKQEWYDRTLVFRADSLPDEAFSGELYKTAEALGLADGEYTAEVTLEGGSGRASVDSPAKITVKDGSMTAEIIWSSNKYDYMIVNGEKILPVSTEEFSVFEIPVSGFDGKLNVSADTTAMSVPYEIEYTLYFDSSTITETVS